MENLGVLNWLSLIGGGRLRKMVANGGSTNHQTIIKQMIAESSISQMDDSAAICFTNESRKKKQTNKQHQRTNDSVNDKDEAIIRS